MRIYSYVVRYDYGFAPNPYFGACTLATCKQDIRARASVGDFLLGTGSAEKSRAGYLVYAMQIDEVLTYDRFWADERFAEKRPKMRGSRKQAHGDNIYHRDASGNWLQADSRHSSADGSPNSSHIKRDTKSDRVLVGRQFAYFGGEGPLVPESLRTGFGRDIVLAGRGYLSRFEDDQISATIDWVGSLDIGVLGRPLDWPDSAKAPFKRAA